MLIAAGAVFVLEELVRRFEPRIAIVVLAATASAMSVARVLLGDAPEFHVEVVDYGNPITHLLYGVFGLIAGGAAILHNKAILGAMALAGPMRGVPAEVRAAVVGMAAFFCGVVRAPITGIVLVTEMTASVDLLLPMLGACFASMLVPTLLGQPPIYESPRAGTLRREAEMRGG